MYVSQHVRLTRSDALHLVTHSAVSAQETCRAVGDPGTFQCLKHKEYVILNLAQIASTKAILMYDSCAC